MTHCTSTYTQHFDCPECRHNLVKGRSALALNSRDLMLTDRSAIYRANNKRAQWCDTTRNAAALPRMITSDITLIRWLQKDGRNLERDMRGSFQRQQS